MKEDENAIIQDYIARFYGGARSTQYHQPKFNTPHGRFIKEIVPMLMKNDIVGLQQKAKEAVEWNSK